MKNLLIATSLLLLAGCAGQKYEKMKTMDEYLNAEGGEPAAHGMAITKKGAVLDVTVEEVQAQKKRLEETVFNLERKVKSLEEENAELTTKNRELRLVAGLKPTEDKIQVTGYDSMGVPSFGPKPKTHDDEIKELRAKAADRTPASAAPATTAEAPQPAIVGDVTSEDVQ